MSKDLKTLAFTKMTDMPFVAFNMNITDFFIILIILEVRICALMFFLLFFMSFEYPYPYPYPYVPTP